MKKENNKSAERKEVRQGLISSGTGSGKTAKLMLELMLELGKNKENKQ